MAVEVLEVAPSLGDAPDPAKIADRSPPPSRTGSRSRPVSPSGRGATAGPRATAAHTSAPVVLFDDDASDRATVVEVRAPDGVGVLYRITHALAECGVDILSAKVLTLGHEVVDSFYVTEVGGAKVVGTRPSGADRGGRPRRLEHLVSA